MGFLHQQEFRRFVTSLPRSSRAALILTIFCLFATFGFVGDVASMGRHSVGRIVFDVAFSGAMAILYSFVGTRSGRAFGALVLVQIVITVLVARWSPDFLIEARIRSAAEAHRRLGVDAFGITMGVMVGYSALTQLLTREGARYQRMRTEMTLARNIHRGLVPILKGQHDGLEFAGASYPSGEVGGDLVDAVDRRDGRWFGYVADVSGHGVQAGVVMAMVKSAVRMGITRGASIDALLAESNDVLMPLVSANMFVTAAFVEAANGSVEVGLAGHLPILHYRRAAQAVEEVSVRNVALGFFAGTTYLTRRLTCACGDVLVLLTDGFIEVFDRNDREFGLDAVKDVLVREGTRPLEAILASITAAAHRHGPQRDDQTALLIRFTATADRS